MSAPRCLRPGRRYLRFRAWWRAFWDDTETINGPGSEGE